MDSAELKNLMDDWIRVLFQTFRANIEKKNLKLTNELIDSFQYHIEMNTQKLSGVIFLEFAQQGRFQDMKVLKYNKMPPIAEILKFVEKKGINNFKSFAEEGKRFNRVPLSNTRRMRNLAWGIAMSKKNKVVKNKKTWKYSKTLYKEVQDLKDAVFLFLQGYTTEQLKKMLNINT